MYPHDNIFKIYYNIGKRLPFQVKRSPLGLKGSRDENYRYSQEGKTFMVEEIKIHNKIYGSAKGYCLIDGERCDEYMKETYKETEFPCEIPCAGCGEWVLIDVPGVDMNEIFPVHKVGEVVPFGKYKGKTIEVIYKIDPKYIFWLAESDPYFRIDFPTLTGIDPQKTNAEELFKEEVDRVFPKVKVEDSINFGKYKGKTYKEIIEVDPQYVEWVIHNNRNLDFDLKSFFEALRDARMKEKV